MNTIFYIARIIVLSMILTCRAAALSIPALQLSLQWNFVPCTICLKFHCKDASDADNFFDRNVGNESRSAHSILDRWSNHGICCSALQVGNLYISTSFFWWTANARVRKINSRCWSWAWVGPDQNVATLLNSLVKSYIAFAALYGLMFGVGIGLAYSAPLVCGARWVPQRKGLINGVVTAGFGLGAFAFNFVITALVNPHNNSPCVYNNATCPWGVEGSKKTYFDPQGDVASRVPHLLLILAAAYAALVIVGASMLTNPAAALQRKRDRFVLFFVCLRNFGWRSCQHQTSICIIRR